MPLVHTEEVTNHRVGRVGSLKTLAGLSLVANICDPAREAAERGRGVGRVTLWCGTCSAEDQGDTSFYKPPHEVGHNRPLSGWVT